MNNQYELFKRGFILKLAEAGLTPEEFSDIVLDKYAALNSSKSTGMSTSSILGSILGAGLPSSDTVDKFLNYLFYTLPVAAGGFAGYELAKLKARPFKSEDDVYLKYKKIPKKYKTLKMYQDAIRELKEQKRKSKELTHLSDEEIDTDEIVE